MDIRPITNDADYEEALAEIRRLWAAEAGTPERNTLEVLAMLAHAYERAREPLPSLNPIDAITFRLEQLGLRRNDLLPIFGTTGRISEIMGGKRALTIAMIRRLHGELDIPLEALIGESRVRKGRQARSKPKARAKLRLKSHGKSARAAPPSRHRSA